MQDSLVDQHERDRFGVALLIGAHEDAEPLENLRGQPRARAVHADHDDRACLSQPFIHWARKTDGYRVVMIRISADKRRS